MRQSVSIYSLGIRVAAAAAEVGADNTIGLFYDDRKLNLQILIRNKRAFSELSQMKVISLVMLRNMRFKIYN